MLWIALHLPALALESWAATMDPVQAGRPRALLAEHVVALADAAAIARGVRAGMKRATALALAPDLLLGQADPARDVRALRAVADVALAFSPAVAWATPPDWRPALGGEHGLAPDPAPSPSLVGVRLEVQSCLRYFGGLAPLLARLRDALAPLGHRLSLACAPTALGAALLAAWRDDLAQGAHATQLPALQALLDAVPLHLLGPGRQHWEALQGMGLRTLADLGGLPRAGLARRFGPGLLADIDRARGAAPEVHRWLTLAPRFASRIELFARADSSAQVLAGADVLLPRLVAWARARQVRIVRFRLVLHHEPRHRHDSDACAHSAIEIAPAQPSIDAGHLRSLLVERLARLPLAAPALELSLECDATLAGATPAGELFPSRTAEHEGLARLVERLQARLGREQVLRLVAVSDHRPECGTRWLPADPARLHDGPAGDADAGRQALALGVQPLWLLPLPQPLHERDQGPLLDGRPLRLLAGPERLETGWWDDQLALRDYFIAQDGGGALVWIYRRRLPAEADGPGWFLHGLFA
jgi:protein ImuB